MGLHWSPREAKRQLDSNEKDLKAKYFLTGSAMKECTFAFSKHRGKRGRGDAFFELTLIMPGRCGPIWNWHRLPWGV